MVKYETTDLWFAAFLRHKKIPLLDFNKFGPRKVQYIFEIDENTLKSLRMEFLNSDISKIKQLIEELKDLGY